MGYARVLLDTINNVVSKVGELTCKLVGKSGKDVFELPPVVVMLGTEKAGTQAPIIGSHF